MVRSKPSKLFEEFGMSVDEDGNNDVDENDELEEEYDDVNQEDDEKDDEKNEVDDKAEQENNDESEDEKIDENETVDDKGIDDDECLYNFGGKKKKGIDVDSDEEYEEEFENDYEEIKQKDNVVKPEDRITGNALTKYERVRLLAERSRILMTGAKPMLKGTDGMNPKDIARLELNAKKIPLKIYRQRPDGKIEIWKLEELMIIN